MITKTKNFADNIKLFSMKEFQTDNRRDENSIYTIESIQTTYLWIQNTKTINRREPNRLKGKITFYEDFDSSNEKIQKMFENR